MTEPRTFKVATALSRQLATPGGRSLAEAQRRADEGLEVHREGTLADVGRLVDDLEALCAAADPASAPAVYPCAAALIDLAGFFDTGALYEAGYSLCELSDRMREAGVWSWPAVDVHVRALRLIHAGGCQDGETARVLLEGLRSVLAAAAPSPKGWARP